MTIRPFLYLHGPAMLIAMALLSTACSTPRAGYTITSPEYVIHSGEPGPLAEQTEKKVVRIFQRYKKLFRAEDRNLGILYIHLNGSGRQYDEDHFPALYVNSTRSIHFRAAPDNMLLMHEIAHHFMPEPKEKIPVWLNEGVATYLGWSALDDERILVGEIPIIHYKTLKHLDRENRLLPIRELIRLTPSLFYDERDSLQHYSQAWGLVFYLFRCHFSKELDFRGKLDRLLAMREEELLALEKPYRRFCREFSATQMMTERLVAGPNLRQLSSAYRLGLLQDVEALDALLDLALDERKSRRLRSVAMHSSAMIAVGRLDYRTNRRLMHDLRRLKYHESPEIQETAMTLHRALGRGDRRKVADLFSALSGESTFYPAARIEVKEGPP